MTDGPLISELAEKQHLYLEVDMPTVVRNEEEEIEFKIKKRAATRFLRAYALETEDKKLKNALDLVIGPEPSGLKKPIRDVNRVIDYIVRTKQNGAYMNDLNERFGVNFLQMRKVVAYAKFEYDINIVHDEQINTYYWIPEPPEEVNEEVINEVLDETKVTQSKGGLGKV